MRIYTGLIKDLGCRCFYYDSGMNIPIGFVCAEIPDISSILSSKYAIRMIKLDDRLNIMNIEYYHDAYISFVRSRLNGVMDLYKSYDNISVDDVMDMIKDITEDRLIIQYCSL